MSQKVITIKGQKFLIHSVLKLSKTVNVLGFFETTPGRWNNHVQSLTLTHEEWQDLSGE